MRATRSSRFLVAAALAAGVTTLSDAPAIVGASTGSRTFTFTYEARVSELPVGGRQLRIWVPLARSHENQEIRARRIQAPGTYDITEEPVYDNDMLYLTLQAPWPSPLTVVVEYDAVVHGGQTLQSSPHPVTPATEEPEVLQRNLRHEPLIVVDETVQQITEAATAGRTDDLARARAIYDYVIAHMRYDKSTPGWGRGDTLRACRLGAGNCTDFHSLFISMARAAGIPARFVIGATVPQGPEGEIPGYHCWAEFYTPQHGWMPVDASEAWKHPERREEYFGLRDPDKFSISEGRNLQLVPAQAGEPVNIFLRPYVEVDGLPWDKVETRFRYHNHKEERT